MLIVNIGLSVCRRIKPCWPPCLPPSFPMSQLGGCVWQTYWPEGPCVCGISWQPHSKVGWKACWHREGRDMLTIHRWITVCRTPPRGTHGASPVYTQSKGFVPLASERTSCPADILSRHDIDTFGKLQKLSHAAPPILRSERWHVITV